MTRAFYHEWPRSDEYSIAPVPGVDGYARRMTIAWRPGMRRDFRDLRFRAPDLRPCAHGEEVVTEGVSAVIWVQLYAGQTRLELLWGHGAAVSVADLSTVFPFFEPFSAAIDTGVWTAWGQYPVTDGVVQVGVSSESYLARKTASALGYAVVASARFDNTDLAWLGWTKSVGSTMSAYITAFSPTNAMYGNISTYGATAHGETLTDALHTLEVERLTDQRARYSVDGEVVYTTSDTPQTGSWYPTVHGYATPVYVDWLAVRPTQATEPVLSLVRSGPNPWYPAVASWISRGIPAAWEDQRLVGYSVSRAIADSLWRMSGTFDGAGTHAIASFPRVTLAEPDASGIERPLWHGVVPEFGFTHADAADETSFVGYDYGYFLSTRPLPLSMTLLPAATDPGTFLKTYFDDADEWGGELVPFDTSNIHAVTGWGSTITARDIALSESSSVLQACERLADEIGWIFYVGWTDVGTTPSYNHPDPALRILRLLAHEFDEGGEGVAYHDSNPKHLLNQPRMDEGVDLYQKPDGTGWLIWDFHDGTEWVQWTVPIAVTGTWTMRVRAVAEILSGGPWSYAVYVDGVKAADVPVPTLSPYSPEWDLSNIPWSDDVELALTAGDVVFRIAFDNVPYSYYGHYNFFECFELTPPVPEGATASEYRPAIYFCDAEKIDDPDEGLDLPPPVTVTPDDPHLVGQLEYAPAFQESANAVLVRYAETEGGATAEVSAHGLPSVGGWIYHVETIREATSTAAAQARADELLAYYAARHGTITASFSRRTDLRLFQLISFRGFDGVPEIPMRITSIKYAVEFADVEVTITAMPDLDGWLLRRLYLAANPDLVSETKAVASSVVMTQKEIWTYGWIIALPGGGYVTVQTITNLVINVRGSGGIGDYGPIYQSAENPGSSLEFAVWKPY